MGPVKLDATSLEIVRLLQNGRMSFKEIGRAVGLSEATVRTRVTRLTNEGLVDIKALVSTKDMEIGYNLAYVGVRLKSPAMKEVAAKVSTVKGVISVAIVTGRYDLILTIMLAPDFSLMDFFDEMLARHADDISLNETFMVYESVNLKTPYPF